MTSVAALGVFNTTLLNTREQVREIGILKAIGMTPRQVTTMVISSLAALGVVFGALATPLGSTLHGMVLQAMADAAATKVPGSFVAVFGPTRFVALAGVGLVIAVIGALIPATWAARATAAVALRAE